MYFTRPMQKAVSCQNYNFFKPQTLAGGNVGCKALQQISYILLGLSNTSPYYMPFACVSSLQFTNRNRHAFSFTPLPILGFLDVLCSLLTFLRLLCFPIDKSGRLEENGRQHKKMKGKGKFGGAMTVSTAPSIDGPGTDFHVV